MDGYLNDTGFPLTAGHQLACNRMLASLAHARGMSVGLKGSVGLNNDLPHIPELVADLDFAVNEECAQYDDCAALTPFVRAGKAVLHVEYAVPVGDFRERSRELGLSSMRKEPDLGAWRQPC